MPSTRTHKWRRATLSLCPLLHLKIFLDSVCSRVERRPRELIISHKNEARRAHCTGIIFGFECFRLKLCGASRCVVVDVHSFQIDRQTAVPKMHASHPLHLGAEMSAKPKSQPLISHLPAAWERDGVESEPRMYSFSTISERFFV